ncbi:hypothetical protein [Novosphingobium kaempferiae]|uniref:hypothetical protein n=1 Tax=Novosphingobium kaempferiae TaxID=2896849 RepID=UPI001E591610|nr:hypothetical protein [Novosphingobium kaempferiae]
MLHKLFERGDWFPPKRYGYGAGLPIAWQGWFLMASYLGTLAGIALLDRSGMPGGRALALALFIVVTACFLIAVARRTQGGWKWRWGQRD